MLNFNSRDNSLPCQDCMREEVINNRIRCSLRRLTIFHFCSQTIIITDDDYYIFSYTIFILHNNSTYII